MADFYPDELIREALDELTSDGLPSWTTEMRIGNAHPAFKRENIRPRFLLQLRLRITMVNVHLTTHVWSAEGLVEHRYCRGQGG